MSVTSPQAVQSREEPVYRPFHVEVRRAERLSPSFLRVTFTGELDDFADHGLDQRIKLVLPLAGEDPGYGFLDGTPDWFGAWRALADDRRNPLRTYTVRGLRRDPAELDVDFVLHGDSGPATRWANRVTPGDRLVVVGPNARCAGSTRALEWAPPPGADRLLLAGDETAVPAICSIVSALPPGVRGRVLLEVPDPGDALPLAAPAGVEVSWLPRPHGAAHGDLLIPAVAGAVRDLAAPAAPAPVDLEDVDIDTAILWESAAGEGGDGFYAWLAGEAGMVKTLRRVLVRDAGVNRSSVAFMGYWRLGRAEN
ncbi:NADPH-dependent ferric siderophore reductase [Thermocatellispora tengchongensis]|uniref:NADPH-dependent ferric siderophore reductase n=1 Tax=Thermocatellispora tengchongensis TaxID=1073253 RepID=A0A840P2W7_9ACTN|nr:siderophore-interacting protein [Thermocatellispora tengchongensis]MBB5131587.1 NADPH-dependent ferric siderophore reductase [Thermocatellispora tengchongensis]